MEGYNVICAVETNLGHCGDTQRGCWKSTGCVCKCVRCEFAEPAAADEAPRMAECTRCGDTAESAKVRRNMGFTDRGPGSKDATERCACGYYKCAHERQPRNIDPRSVIELGECAGFTPRGPMPTDLYWCGCGDTD